MLSLSCTHSADPIFQITSSATMGTTIASTRITMITDAMTLFLLLFMLNMRLLLILSAKTSKKPRILKGYYR